MLFDSKEYREKIAHCFDKYKMSGYNIIFKKEKNKEPYYLVEFNDLDYIDDPKLEYVCFMIKRNDLLISNAASKRYDRKRLLDLANDVLLGSTSAKTYTKDREDLVVRENVNTKTKK